MLDATPEKLLVVGFIAFVVLGPDRLPQAARSLGRLVANLRRMSSGFQSEVRGALAEPTESLQSAIGDWRPSDLRKAVRDTVSSTLVPPTNGAGRANKRPPAAGTPVPRTEADRAVWGESAPMPDDPSLN